MCYFIKDFRFEFNVTELAAVFFYYYLHKRIKDGGKKARIYIINLRKNMNKQNEPIKINFSQHFIRKEIFI